jgi:glutamyl/glutaminyl-tRNA synthetase
VDKVLKKPFALENLSALRSAFAALEKWDAQSLEITLKMVAGVREVKTGDLVHPARVAVSGRSIGPSLYHMLEVMGKERVLSRFDRALAMF